jgi:tetratricopeptide (TPR) repeat protein
LDRVPEISFRESSRQIQALSARAQDLEKGGDWAGAIAVLHEMLDHPCAQHQIVAYEVWDDIHELHKRAGDYDAAIAAKRQAVRAGYRSVPDPEADIAECLLLAGCRLEADALFAELRTRDPDDVWLYNSAGFAFSDAGDPAESARWFRDGIDVAMRTGDPDQAVVQLLEGLQAAWRELGREPEPELAERVDSFVQAWRRPAFPAGPHWDDLPPLDDHPCRHCGYDPDLLGHPGGTRSPGNGVETPGEGSLEIFGGTGSRGPGAPVERIGRPAAVALAWFSRPDWAEATATWPSLLDDLPADHDAYSQRIEARLKRLARTLVGHPIRVAPLTVDGLMAFAVAHDEDPGSGAARAAYAAEVDRLGSARPWPPGRNAPCWCGSGRKYKACCGPAPVAPE